MIFLNFLVYIKACAFCHKPGSLARVEKQTILQYNTPVLRHIKGVLVSYCTVYWDILLNHE